MVVSRKTSDGMSAFRWQAAIIVAVVLAIWVAAFIVLILRSPSSEAWKMAALGGGILAIAALLTALVLRNARNAVRRAASLGDDVNRFAVLMRSEVGGRPRLRMLEVERGELRVYKSLDDATPHTLAGSGLSAKTDRVKLGGLERTALRVQMPAGKSVVFWPASTQNGREQLTPEAFVKRVLDRFGS